MSDILFMMVAQIVSRRHIHLSKRQSAQRDYRHFMTLLARRHDDVAAHALTSGRVTSATPRRAPQNTPPAGPPHH